MSARPLEPRFSLLLVAASFEHPMGRKTRGRPVTAASAPAAATAGPRRCSRPWLVGLLLVAATAAAFSPVVHCNFAEHLDDDVYVTGNDEVRAGLTAHGLRWAWTTRHASNWHPLTWLSLMLDAQLFGLSPVGFHLTNLLLHIGNTLLLFTLLQCLTGYVGRSAWVAALFALHPLHVESVAWVSERKDVLSTFFGLLALLAYARYAQSPRMGRYMAVGACFALSLLAKPMLVTLPLLLLVLDWWPLRRWPGLGGASGRARLVAEKVPLVVLALASCAATVWAQGTGGAVVSLVAVPLWARILNAILSYAQYLRQMLLPVDLAAYYPYHEPRLGAALLAGAILLGVSGVAWRLRGRCPYLLVGWLWYLGTLVPVIGLVQVGMQAHADRYTYFPLIGPFLALVWGLADLASRQHWERPAISLGAGALLFLSVGTWVQVHYWQNSLMLWHHALEVTPPNPFAEQSLGVALLKRGDFLQARPHLERALQLGPEFPELKAHLGMALVQAGELERGAALLEQAARTGTVLPAWASVTLGLTYAALGRTAESIDALKEALRQEPGSVDAHIGLGFAYATQGQWQKAIDSYQEALRLEPHSAKALCGLGLAHAGLGHWPQAVQSLSQAVVQAPQLSVFHRKLAHALYKQGDRARARSEYKEASRLEPGWPQACAQQAWTLATHPEARVRNASEALRLAEEVCQAADAPDAGALDVLAAAQAENGQYAEAAATARRARDLAAASKNSRQERDIEEHLRNYEAGRPLRVARPGGR